VNEKSLLPTETGIVHSIATEVRYEAGISWKHDILYVLNINKVLPERIKEFIDVIILSTELFRHVTISLCGDGDIDHNGLGEGDWCKWYVIKSCDYPYVTQEADGGIKVAHYEAEGG
jgi:hypothetical protein